VSFDLLGRLSGLGLLQGLPLLKFESDFVCAPCHHGKMIATSHYLVNIKMTEHPGQLLHMDNISPSWVRSMGGKWYVLVIVDDYSNYSWVFFLESEDEVFEHIRSLALRLNNEHPNCLKAIHSDDATLKRCVPLVLQRHALLSRALIMTKIQFLFYLMIDSNIVISKLQDVCHTQSCDPPHGLEII
jgi:hypothetical protein